MTDIDRKLQPVDGPKGERKRLGRAAELADVVADAPTDEYERLRADHDAIVDQDPTPRYWVG